MATMPSLYFLFMGIFNFEGTYKKVDRAESCDNTSDLRIFRYIRNIQRFQIGFFEL